VNPAAEGGTTGEKWPRILLKVANSTSLLGSSTCRKARHGTYGFTSPPKEGVLRIFSPEKSDGLVLHIKTLIKTVNLILFHNAEHF
jgi:hypothetical protein